MFNPHDWYWQADDGRVFSSFYSDLVKKGDSRFKDWKEAGGTATRWPQDAEGNQTDAALDAVLHLYGISVGLDALKTATTRRINDAAELCRGRYITSGDGQMMTYLEKITQARSCVSSQSPLESDYPMLAAEIGITAPTLAGVAEVVIEAYNQWIVIGSAIEAVRRAANIAVLGAKTTGEVKSAFEGIVWPE